MNPKVLKLFNKVIINKFYAALLVIIVIHIFSSPTYYAISNGYKTCTTCCNMQQKIDRKNHLLNTVSHQFEASTHMAKTEFRLTPPILAKVFFINTPAGMYILQVITGFLFFVMLYSLIYSIIPNYTITFISILAFGFIYQGYSFISEMEGFFDSFAFIFLLIALLDVHLIILALTLFLAYYTDERSVFSSFLIVFYWQYRNHTQNQKKFFLPSKQAYIMLITLLLYLVTRWILVNYFGFVNQFAGTNTLIYTINYAGIAFWQAFEGFWFLIVLAILALYNQKKYAVALIFLILNALIFSIGMSVMDITRSIAYVFPSIIISLYILKDYFEYHKLKQVMLICLLFCFMYPSYNFIVGKPPHSYNPIYIRVAKKLLHIP